MGRIETRIKEAFEQYKKDGNLLELVKEIADVGDCSVNCKYHAGFMYDAIREYCPKSVFECVFYDGEHGHYQLFDFDPNNISKESLLIEAKARLQSECFIDSDYIDKAMENIYLIDTNIMIKAVTKMKSDIDGALNISDTVDIIAKGYEWICPKCEFLNTEIEYTKQVQCFICERVFETNPPKHAME